MKDGLQNLKLQSRSMNRFFKTPYSLLVTLLLMLFGCHSPQLDPDLLEFLSAVTPVGPHSVLAEHGDYQVLRPEGTMSYRSGGWGRIEKLIILFRGCQIYEYTPHLYKGDVFDPAGVYLIHDWLRLDKNVPQPFQDITGDGVPNLVIIEEISGGTYPNSHKWWITVLALHQNRVVALPPFSGSGEGYRFDDPDNDGYPELCYGWSPNAVDYWGYDSRKQRFVSKRKLNNP